MHGLNEKKLAMLLLMQIYAFDRLNWARLHERKDKSYIVCKK